MPTKKDTWVLGIEQERANAPYKQILWGIILLLSALFFYFSDKRPEILGGFTEIIKLFLIIVFLIAVSKLTDSPKNPDYLAYFIYQIGYELPDFERESSYLKRNRDHIKNCEKQISDLIEQNSEYFVDNIFDFFNKLHDIILRLNHIYSNEDMADNIKAKLDGMSSEQFMTEREFISSKLIDLSNLIHKENSSLTSTHVNLANEILDELKDIPEKTLKKDLSEYPKKRWKNLRYEFKDIIFGATVFGTLFLFLALILELLEQENPYSIAMLTSAPLTVVVLIQIDRFITRERVKIN